jgi:hypothetical protein
VIDETVFKDTWALLCDRFNRAPSTPLMLAYHGTLKHRLTTEQFKAAAQKIFEEREFFPRPADFLEAGQPDLEAAALEQWEVVQDVMRGFGGHDRLTEEARRVMSLLGGETKLRNTQLDSVQYVRRDFLQLYGDAVQVARREGGERIAPTAESLRLTAQIMEQLKP